MYHLMHRYQDSGWRYVHDINEPFNDLKRAKRRAKKLSLNPIAYGTLRVVDNKGTPIADFVSGEENPYDPRFP